MKSDFATIRFRKIKMILSIQINDRNDRIETCDPIDISIPLKFGGEQPNAYNVKAAKKKPYESGGLIGDTRLGGSCNFEEYSLIPHCNGTHTECIGHITNERIAVRDCLQDAFILSRLVSVKPAKAGETSDTYGSSLKSTDLLITRQGLENQLANILSKQGLLDSSGDVKNRSNFPSGGLIVRTLPNRPDKLTQKYGDYVSPFFSLEAMDFIVELGVKHLLVDVPSIDRIFDAGKLENHRKFWSVEAGKFAANENSTVNNTITEMIYVGDEVKDGNYLLNLQIAPFQTDASPSRPILFEIKG